MAFAPQAIFRKVPAARKVWKHKANPAILLHFLFLGVFCTTNIAIITFLCIAIELKKQAPWKFGRFKEALENMTSLSQCPGPCFHNIFPNYFRLPQFAAKKYNFIKHDIWTCHTVFQVDWPSHCSSQVLISISKTLKFSNSLRFTAHDTGFINSTVSFFASKFRALFRFSYL